MNTISNTDLKADNPAVAQNHLFSFVLYCFCSFDKWFNAVGYSVYLPNS
jgi:hypothetical protein